MSEHIPSCTFKTDTVDSVKISESPLVAPTPGSRVSDLSSLRLTNEKLRAPATGLAV